MVIYRLWERHNYYYAVEHFDEIYQRHLPAHTTMEAKQIAFDEHAREINEAQVREGSEITSLAIIKEGCLYRCVLRVKDQKPMEEA